MYTISGYLNNKPYSKRRQEIKVASVVGDSNSFVLQNVWRLKFNDWPYLVELLGGKLYLSLCNSVDMQCRYVIVTKFRLVLIYA